MSANKYLVDLYKRGLILFPLRDEQSSEHEKDPWKKPIWSWKIGIEESRRLIKKMGKTHQNWGIRTGEEGGIIVVDIDTKDCGLEFFRYWLSTLDKDDQAEVFDTLVVKTTSGGYHLYYQSEEDVDEFKTAAKVIKIDGVGLGIDIRNNGGYIAAPGNKNFDTGKLYTVEYGESIGPMPRCLYKLLEDGENYKMENFVGLPTQIKEYIENNKPKSKSAKKVDVTKNTREAPADCDEIQELLSLLHESRAREYDKWRNVGFALHTKGLFKEFDEFSKRCGEKYNADEVKGFWDKINHKEGGITMASLYYWLKEDIGEDRYKEFMKKWWKGGIDPKEDYYWNDFIRGLKCTYEDVRVLIRDLQRVLAYIEGAGKSFFVVKIYNQNSGCVKMDVQSTDAFYTSVKVHSVKVRIRYKDKKGEEVENLVTMTIKEIVERWNYMIMYDGMGLFEPESVRGRFLSMFGGFRAREVEKIDEEKIEKIQRHIFEVWAAKDEVKYKYIMNWFAHLVQKPHEKIKTVLVLISLREGAGKNIILDWITDKIIGQHSITVNDMSSLTGNYNGYLEDKVLIVGNEICSDSIGKRFVDWNKMKSYITDGNITYEAKYQNQREGKNYWNFILTSNSLQAVKISDSDRRYCILVCDESKVGDHKYFKELHKSLSQETADIFYSWLKKRDIEEFYPQRIPECEVKREIQEAQLSLSRQWLRETTWEGEWTGNEVLSSLNWWMTSHGYNNVRYTIPKLFLELSQDYGTLIKKIDLGGKRYRYIRLKQE